jgi:hypothetical protein
MTTPYSRLPIRKTGIGGFAIIFCLLLVATLYADQSACPPIGAIRWDAWHGKHGPVGVAVEKSLGPSQWHSRIPFCGRVRGNDQVEIECDSLDVMEKEIRYAEQAGISYWAFLAYDQNDPLSLSFRNYLASPNKDKIKFSLISQFGRWGSRKTYLERNKYFIELMKDPSYQKVKGNRPLFFVYKIEEERLQSLWGGVSGFRPVIDQLRSDAVKAGLENPYIVVMDASPERAKKLSDDLGFDAISSYATFPGKEGKGGAPFYVLSDHVRNYWEISKRTGGQVVPLVMAGWDNRPRASSPGPWQKASGQKLGQIFFTSPKPEELAKLVADAINWTSKNSDRSGPNPIIIYAWNEHDEGGWIAPTLGEGDARVAAVGKTVLSICRSK